MVRKKIVRVTTVPLSLNLLLKGQLAYLNQFYEVIALSSPGEDLEKVKSREKVRTVGIKMEREIKLFADIKSLIRLICFFIHERPEIVHANTPKGSLLALIAAKVAGVPIRIYTVTGLRFENEEGFRRKLLIGMEKLTCYSATNVVAESKGVKQFLTKFEITRKNIDIIGNGNINGIDDKYWNKTLVDATSKEELLLNLGLTHENFVISFVGRIVVDKGIHELVEAFKSFYKEASVARLLLIGSVEDGSNTLSPGILSEIKTHPGIICVGFQEDVRLFLSVSHLLALPSYREGFPNVILQAGAMELPVVCTDVHGAVEVVDGMNATIVPKRSSVALLQAIKEIALKFKIINAAYCRHKVVENYSQEKLFPKILNYYNSIGQ
jgi:glycosyltransferase involved in cell wall biosynthesis